MKKPKTEREYLQIMYLWKYFYRTYVSLQSNRHLHQRVMDNEQKHAYY